MAERALVTDTLQHTDIAQLRALMDEARARRLQPHYIEGAFLAAFTRLGGKIRRRERARFEITHVPAQLRTVGRGPIATRYDRVTFDIEHVLDDAAARAELLAPGHPLHDAVTDETVARWRRTLERGAVLVSPVVQEPRLLVGVIEEIVDAVHRQSVGDDGDPRHRTASAVGGTRSMLSSSPSITWSCGWPIRAVAQSVSTPRRRPTPPPR
jgi:hypothetical protein